MFSDKKILVVGLGNMACLLLRVLLKENILKKEQIFAVSHGGKSTGFIEELGIQTFKKTDSKDFDFIFLGLKPQIYMAVLSIYEGFLRADGIVISMMAGPSVDKIKSVLPNNKNHKVVRIMPNIPCAIGQGVIGCYSKHLEAMSEVLKMFHACGEVFALKEEAHLDIVTAISGSGPAYFYYFMEVMIDKANELGLDSDLSARLVTATCKGAGAYAFENIKDLNVIQMRNQVTSAGGTTEAGLKALLENDVSQHISDAISNAYKKSKRLNE